jgi:hypothetical protein
MAQFISIATTIAGTPTLQLNTNMILHVAYVSATSVVIYMGSRIVTLTVAGATTTNFYNAVLAAIASQVPSPLVEVVLPTGVTVTAAAITT